MYNYELLATIEFHKEGNIVNKHYPMIDSEIKNLADQIRRNLTAIELNDTLTEEETFATIEWLKGARESVENAAFYVKG